MQTTEITNNNLEWFMKQTIKTQMEIFGHTKEISKLIANQLFQDEVHQKDGRKYERALKEEQKHSNWGSNQCCQLKGKSKKGTKFSLSF
ncbi:MAG: hypothetical protein KKF62_12850 [Bacteroidetes bacterium]|nr:hypothetical protein [Bacteroidota bacterium]MBU1116412.1 hypothetical protein [Bacteroidota bacterium]MBU1798697.1 hypothetical protein [Bacteroidota bacterium]